MIHSEELPQEPVKRPATGLLYAASLGGDCSVGESEASDIPGR